MGLTITCHGCGQPLPVPGAFTRRKIQCPECGVYSELPATTPKKPPAPMATAAPAPSRKAAPVPPAVPEVQVEERRPSARAAPLPEAMPVGSEEDDGGPYALAGGPERKCPHCNKLLEAKAVLCRACGFNLETGKKPVKVHDVVARYWESGLPLARRVRLFALAQVVVLPLSALGAWLMGRSWSFVLPWLIFTGVVAFLLGTFDRLDLTRTKRGRVVLTRTWRVCFFARRPDTIPLREYEGVAVGPAQGSDIMEWGVLVGLFLVGFLPGLLWWFLAFNHDSFYVALTQNHGYPERILYQGWSQSRAREIAQTLHEVAELPFQG